MKDRIFQAGKPVTRLSHTVEVVVPEPKRVPTLNRFKGYDLTLVERGHRNCRAASAKASRARNRR